MKDGLGCEAGAGGHAAAVLICKGEGARAGCGAAAAATLAAVRQGAGGQGGWARQDRWGRKSCGVVVIDELDEEMMGFGESRLVRIRIRLGFRSSS